MGRPSCGGEWGHVKPPLSIYMSLDGQAVHDDPRRTVEYRDRLVKSLHLDGDDEEGLYAHLGSQDKQAFREVMSQGWSPVA